MKSDVSVLASLLRLLFSLCSSLPFSPRGRRSLYDFVPLSPAHTCVLLSFLSFNLSLHLFSRLPSLAIARFSPFLFGHWGGVGRGSSAWEASLCLYLSRSLFPSLAVEARLILRDFPSMLESLALHALRCLSFFPVFSLPVFPCFVALSSRGSLLFSCFPFYRGIRDRLQ